ncbi:MAG: Glutamine-dependent NAD(+) synthetase [Legionellaceae bacterium]
MDRTLQLQVLIAQLNFTVGDIKGNTKKIIHTIKIARDNQLIDLIIFPELAITGYPPEDLLLRKDFLNEVTQALNEICKETLGISVILGCTHLVNNRLFNAAALLQEQQIITYYHKQCLPNYGVFDEKRYFTPGENVCIFTIKGIPLSVLICEDIWFSEPAIQAAEAGAKGIICINASPFSHNKYEKRLDILQQRIRETQLPIIYAHTVGGQDDIIFDGGSIVLDNQGQIMARAPFFEEMLFPLECNFSSNLQIIKQTLPILPPPLECIYQALVLGLKDYVNKNDFPGVLLGLSGGIDSALTLAIAVDALGKEKVKAVLMPSRYTSQLSIDLAMQQIQLLGIQYYYISIEQHFQEFLNTLSNEFPHQAQGIAEENLQARCRGTLLMAISNKTSDLVLITSNKSEVAVGYSTLYGDMVGGYAVLKDVWKTTVFELAKYRNQVSLAIPQEVIKRPPTAELRLNQTDQDTLPPYTILDDILIRYVENNESIDEIHAAGYEITMINKVIHMLHKSEYKRRQCAPGPKITNQAFGRERRYPITNKFPNF